MWFLMWCWVCCSSEKRAFVPLHSWAVTFSNADIQTQTDRNKVVLLIYDDSHFNASFLGMGWGHSCSLLPAGFEPCCFEGAISSSLRAMTLHHFRHIHPFTWVGAVAAAGVATACLPACISAWLVLWERITRRHVNSQTRWNPGQGIAAGKEVCDARFFFSPPLPAKHAKCELKVWGANV